MKNKTCFFVGVIGMILLLTGPSGRAEQDVKPADPIERVTLHVDGMTCKSCVPKLREALLEVPGVKSAEILYSEGQAIVECVKGGVTDAQLVRAIEDESGFFYTYTAKVTNRTE